MKEYVVKQVIMRIHEYVYVFLLYEHNFRKKFEKMIIESDSNHVNYLVYHLFNYIFHNKREIYIFKIQILQLTILFLRSKIVKNRNHKLNIVL